jgi:hypothetical protein
MGASDRLSMEHHLARIMQRIAKYHLLLQAVLKPTTDTSMRDVCQLMIDKAKDAANRVNVELCHKKQYETLCGVMRQIETHYEPPEVTAAGGGGGSGTNGNGGDELMRFVRSHVGVGWLDLTRPMPYCRNAMLRQLMHRGDLKMRDGTIKVSTMCWVTRLSRHAD